jgi:hypothetical protein
MLNFVALQTVLELGHWTVALLVNTHVGERYFLGGRILALVELLQALGTWLVNNSTA